MLKTGTIIADKYEVIREIGHGGMSRVYLAMDVSLNKQWALKEIDKTSHEYQSVDTPRVLTEVEMMKDFDHPFLPRIVDIIDTEKSLFIVMDYIEGETLAKVLDMYGPVKQEEVVKWSLELCDVLNYLHHQDPPIIYRDMKPSNVMLKPEGDIKVIDFGIARKYKPGNIEDTVSLGTKGYAAPEQFSGNGQTDQRTDIFNLGVTMYQLLTGKNPAKPPYKIEPITKIDNSLSNGLEKIINKCTREDPEQRYQSAQELAYAIANYRKLDEEEIAKHKKKVMRFYQLLFSGVLVIVLGAGLLFADQIKLSHKYDNLVSANTVTSDQKIGNLKKAIKLKPEKPDAYAELVKEYAKDGFSEEEAAKFSQVYNENESKISGKEEYANLNFIIGKNILMYYNGKSDDSNRNKLITAEPFFADALKAKLNSSDRLIAETYKFLADYYNNFVIAANALEVREASRDDYSKIVSKSDKLLDSFSEYEGENKNHLMLVTCNIIQSFISGERDNAAAKGVSGKVFKDLENKVYKVAKNAKSSSEATNEMKKQVIENHDEIVKELDSSF